MFFHKLLWQMYFLQILSAFGPCESNPCSAGCYTDISCSSGYHCSSTNSCGGCTACEKDNVVDPCDGVTGQSCSYGCKSTGSCGECTSCYTKCEANPCASGCYTNLSCSYGCASTNSCGGCDVCKSCTPAANETGCAYGTFSCSDSCGGTRLCCSSKPEPTVYTWDGTFVNDNNEYCTYSCSCSYQGSGYISSCCTLDGCW